MDASDGVRVSVAVSEVLPGRESEFLSLTGELHRLIRQRGYGSDCLLQDAMNPTLYYDVRTWASAEAVERCDADADVQSLWRRLDKTMRMQLLVGNARFIEGQTSPVVPLFRAPGDRRAAVDRRVTGERRSDLDRRVLDLTPPGMERRNRERRSGLDRRAGWDRRSHETLPVDTGARTVEELLAAASKARLFAQAAFSDFKVGAALETREGIIVTGCNVENATYGLTMCAERVALFKALSEGHRAFSRVVVVTDAVAPVPPCGSCRQLLWEYGGDLEIMLATPSEVKARFRLKELLPLPFDARFLSR